MINPIDQIIQEIAAKNVSPVVPITPPNLGNFGPGGGLVSPIGDIPITPVVNRLPDQPQFRNAVMPNPVPLPNIAAALTEAKNANKFNPSGTGSQGVY